MEGQPSINPETSQQNELISVNSRLEYHLIQDSGRSMGPAGIKPDQTLDEYLQQEPLPSYFDGLRKYVVTEATMKVKLPDGTETEVPIRGEKPVGNIYVDGKTYTIQEYRESLGERASMNDLANLAAFEQEGLTHVAVTRSGRMARYDNKTDNIVQSGK